jgi:hypothetical protein
MRGHGRVASDRQNPTPGATVVWSEAGVNARNCRLALMSRIEVPGAFVD